MCTESKSDARLQTRAERNAAMTERFRHNNFFLDDAAGTDAAVANALVHYVGGLAKLDVDEDDEIVRVADALGDRHAGLDGAAAAGAEPVVVEDSSDSESDTAGAQGDDVGFEAGAHVLGAFGEAGLEDDDASSDGGGVNAAAEADDSDESDDAAQGGSSSSSQAVRRSGRIVRRPLTLVQFTV